MRWRNAISLRHLSPPHRLNGLGHRLKSTSGTEPSPLPHTCDTTPLKSKVAPRLTASQGIDYYSTARTVDSCHHQEGDRCRTDRHTSVDTPYVVITAPVPLHIVKSSWTKIITSHQQRKRYSWNKTPWLQVLWPDSFARIIDHKERYVLDVIYYDKRTATVNKTINSILLVTLTMILRS